MSQTTMSQYSAPSFAGMIDGTGPKVVATGSAEEIIPVAFPVKRGTNAAVGVLKATAGATTIGFAAADQSREQTSAGAVQFAIGDAVNVIKQGRIWVNTNDAVVAGAVANLHVATGNLTDEAVTAGIEAFTQFSARFMTATTAAGLAIVEIK
jgi:hypothetical protein